MKTLIIITSDLKNIFRDRSLSVIVFVPLIFLVLLRFMPAWYEPHVPVLATYRAHILSGFCVVSSALMGFILSFILLDEKDQNLMPVFRVMPLPAVQFLAYRVLMIMGFSFIGNMLIILFSRMVEYTLMKTILLSLACSFIGPSSTFLITGFAKNKIEGVTYFKLFNMLLMAPLAGIFIVARFSLLFGIVPYYWIYAAFIGSQFISGTMCIELALLLNGMLMMGSFYFFYHRTYV